jgi:hypothetical protein
VGALRFNGGMEKAERDAILRQGIVLPETPKDRRERAALEEDLRANPSRGRPLGLRLRNFTPRADAYLAAARGPLRYMLRLRTIEQRKDALEETLDERWRDVAASSSGDDASFAEGWRAEAARVDLEEVNDLIERHNRWYPVESQLPMDPSTGDYALVNGRDYRLAPLDAGWVLERFPASLDEALAA